METTAVINSGHVDEIINVTKSALGLFSTYPLNVFLVASIVSIGIGVFVKLKRS